MRCILTFIVVLNATLLFGRYDTSWIPFRINVIDKNDTISQGLDFFLSRGRSFYCPAFNDSLKCFEFRHVDSLVDFHLNFKNKRFLFREIESVRLMSQSEWFIVVDPTSSDTCYQIIADRIGCFINVQIEEHPRSGCKAPVLIKHTTFSVLPRRMPDYTIRRYTMQGNKRQLKTQTEITLNYYYYTAPEEYLADTLIRHYGPDGSITGGAGGYGFVIRPLGNKEEVIRSGKISRHTRSTVYFADDTIITEVIRNRVRQAQSGFDYPLTYAPGVLMPGIFARHLTKTITLHFQHHEPAFHSSDTMIKKRFLFWSLYKTRFGKGLVEWSSYNHLTRWQKKLSFNDSLQAWYVSSACRFNRRWHPVKCVNRTYDPYRKIYFSNKTFYRYSPEGSIVFERHYDPYLKVTKTRTYYSYEYY